MTQENQQVAIREQGYDLALPDTDTLQRELTAVRAFQSAVKKLLIEGHDYGVIPGTDKPTLFQPGAEKMDKILHLADTYEIVVRQEDWQKPFFYYLVRCKLNIIGTTVQVAEGLGSCNSMEDRYRWRWVFQSQLPNDLQGDAGKLERDRMPHRTITTSRGQAKQYRIENDNIFSLVNTLLKMARKRAHIAASLSAGRLSDVFTQDMEDIAGTVVDNEPEESEISTEHFCQIHKVPFFKKGKMKSYAHKIDGTENWCNEPEQAPFAPPPAPEPQGGIIPPKEPEKPASPHQAGTLGDKKPSTSLANGLDVDYVRGAVRLIAWTQKDMGDYLRLHFGTRPSKDAVAMLEALSTEQAAEFRLELERRVQEQEQTLPY